VHPSDERYAPIVGKLCEIPVGPKEHRRLIPIITDDYPDPAFGSGAVKITGAHDFNDYAVASRNNIPMYRLMDTKAHMRDDGAPYADCAAWAQQIAEGAAFTIEEVDTLNLVPDDLRGLDRFEARRRVVEQITAEGLAVMVEVPDQVRDGQGEPAPEHAPAPEPGPRRIPFVESKLIMQPFGDRSKVVIEPYLTDQWFVDTAKIVQPAIDAVRAGEGAARFVYGLGWHDYIGIEATALDLSASKLGDALPLGLSLRGRLSGAGEFDGIGGSAQAITGEVELEIADARLNTAGLPIPVTSVDLGKIVGSVHAQAGELLLQPIQVDGTDLYGTVRGPIRIRKPFQQSLAELRVRVRFTSDELEGALGSLMPMAGFRQQQEFWERTVRGPLVSLR